MKKSRHWSPILVIAALLIAFAAAFSPMHSAATNPMPAGATALATNLHDPIAMTPVIGAGAGGSHAVMSTETVAPVAMDTVKIAGASSLQATASPQTPGVSKTYSSLLLGIALAFAAIVLLAALKTVPGLDSGVLAFNGNTMLGLARLLKRRHRDLAGRYGAASAREKLRWSSDLALA